MENEHNWYGMLTVGNVEEVAARLSRLLNGKSYTFVMVNEFSQFKPDVRMGQRLIARRKDIPEEEPVDVYYDKENTPPEHAGFNVNDTSGVWGCSTNTTERKKDPEFKNPYLVFECDRVTITRRTSAGDLLYWVIVVEECLE